jgi:alkylation response protein AidB-like acyl-CoA dehydrogenase
MQKSMKNIPTRMQNKLYHDMFSPEETKEIRKNARRFAVTYILPQAHKIAISEESVASFPRALFYELAKNDFFKIPFAKNAGGLGLDYPVCATVATIEELAYVSNSVAAIYDVHCILAGHALEYGSDRIKEEYLKPITTGKKIGCFATTEPDASSELSVRALKTNAVKKDGKYIVNGQKRFITNSCVADFVTALVNVEGKLTMMVIDLKSKGCRVGNPDKKMGNKGQLTADIYFNDVEVPMDNLIGKEGEGLHIALGTLTYGRIGISATGVGMAQSAFDECVDYMNKRKVFGKKVSQYQYWQFKWSERAIEIENARNLYLKAAIRMDQGVEFPEPEAAGAKYYATQLAGDIARDAVQIFGGYGFMQELSHDMSHYKVEAIYRDCKIAEIYEGTNEIQKLIIARSIFGREDR